MKRSVHTVLAVVLVTLFAAWTSVTATPAAAAGSTAVVVIDTGQGVRTAVIHFDGTITGIRALELAGGAPQLQGYTGQGAAVCMIDGYGNDVSQGANCLVGPGSQFWGYFHGGGAWRPSNVGAGGSTVSDGDVEGWRYGTLQNPRASADFCAHVSCAPPPTDPPPSATAAPNVAPPVVLAPPAPGIDFGSASTTAPPSTTNAKSKPGDGSAAAGQDDAAAKSDGSTGSTNTSDGTTTNGRAVSTDRSKDGDSEVALGSSGSGDGGSGSPVGVLIVAGILVVVAAVVVAQRRRTRSSSDL